MEMGGAVKVGLCSFVFCWGRGGGGGGGGGGGACVIIVRVSNSPNDSRLSGVCACVGACVRACVFLCIYACVCFCA